MEGQPEGTRDGMSLARPREAGEHHTATEALPLLPVPASAGVWGPELLRREVTSLQPNRLLPSFNDTV